MFQDKYWKRIRRVANPAFSNRASISLIPLINKHYAKYEEELSKLMNGPAFDLFEVSANISYKQFIDSTFKASKVVEKVPRNTINQLIDVGMDRIRMPWLYPENIWKLSKGSKIMDALAATVDDHFIPAVKDQMAQPDVNGVNFVDIMSRELKNEEQLSFEEIYDNAITMINAVKYFDQFSIILCIKLTISPFFKFIIKIFTFRVLKLQLLVSPMLVWLWLCNRILTQKWKRNFETIFN